MTNELFTTLGIDLTLPPEKVREALEEKNLEYLERLDACSDESRAAELKAIQEDIEAAIQGLADGTLTLPKPTPGSAPASEAPQEGPQADPKVEAALQEGARLLTEQDLAGALEILKPLADQGNESGCILTAQVYKLQGDETGYRRYLFNAAKAGSGDGALLLAQDYFAKGETDQAKKWAGKAHELKTPGAGQLLLRLLGDEKRYGEALGIAAEEIAWLPKFELFALCTDLKTLLSKGAVKDDVAVRMVGPMVQALNDKPEAQKLLDEPYQAAMDRERKREAKAEQKRKAEEQERKAREQDRAERYAKLDEEIKQMEQRQKVEERRKTLPWLVCFLLPPILAVVVHLFVGSASVLMKSGGSEDLIRMVVPPLVAGVICGMTTWLLSGGRQGNYGGNGPVKEFFLMILFSGLFNLLTLMAFGGLCKLAGIEELNRLSVEMGPLVLGIDEFFAVDACVAYFIMGLIGIKHGHG